MKNNFVTVLVAVLLTFVLTENYALSHVNVKEHEPGYYTVEMFGTSLVVK